MPGFRCTIHLSGLAGQTVWGHQLRWTSAGTITADPTDPNHITVVYSDRGTANPNIPDPQCFFSLPGFRSNGSTSRPRTRQDSTCRPINGRLCADRCRTAIHPSQMPKVHVVWTGLNRLVTTPQIDPYTEAPHDGYAQDAMYARR